MADPDGDCLSPLPEDQMSETLMESTISLQSDSTVTSGDRSREESLDSFTTVYLSPKTLIEHLTRPRRRLQRFCDVEIPGATYDRFEDLQKEFGKHLIEHLRKSCTEIGHISTRLICMGEERESAKPWVFVQCEAKIARKIKGFYQKKGVKSQYRPDDPTLPNLEVFVHPHPPKSKAMFIEEDIWGCSGLNGELDAESVHGFRIKVRTNDGRERIATTGGFLKVHVSYGYRLYGLTVGHIFSTPSNATDKILELEDDGGRSWDDDLGYNSDDDSVILDLDPSSLDMDVKGAEDTALTKNENGEEVAKLLISDQKSSKSNLERFVNTAPNSMESWKRVGRSLCPSLPKLSKARDDRDWALLKFNDGWPLRRNQKQAKRLFTKTPILNLPSNQDDWRGQEVKALIGQTENPVQSDMNEVSKTNSAIEAKCGRKGRLSREFSFLLLSSGTEFTKVLTFEFIDDAGGLRAGDCGTWVVDAVTNVLYGHIVASGSMGEVYVVPIESIIEDVKETLNASSVTLPSITDFHNFAANSEHALSKARLKPSQELETPQTTWEALQESLFEYLKLKDAILKRPSRCSHSKETTNHRRASFDSNPSNGERGLCNTSQRSYLHTIPEVPELTKTSTYLGDNHNSLGPTDAWMPFTQAEPGFVWTHPLHAPGYADSFTLAGANLPPQQQSTLQSSVDHNFALTASSSRWKKRTTTLLPSVGTSDPGYRSVATSAFVTPLSRPQIRSATKLNVTQHYRVPATTTKPHKNDPFEVLDNTYIRYFGASSLKVSTVPHTNPKTGLPSANVRANM